MVLVISDSSASVIITMLEDRETLHIFSMKWNSLFREAVEMQAEVKNPQLLSLIDLIPLLKVSFKTVNWTNAIELGNN